MKIFISYHHKREQAEKDQLANLIKRYAYYLNVKDMSVERGNIDPEKPDLEIAHIIRENHLKETTITILILGTHTKCRKHIDWEIEASVSKYGSLNRRKKKNNLIILLTKDFIENRTNYNDYIIKMMDYSSLITEENAGPRIYEIVKKKYAVIDIFDEVLQDITKLKYLLEETQTKNENKNSLNLEVINTNDLPTAILRESNQDNQFDQTLKPIKIIDNNKYRQNNKQNLKIVQQKLNLINKNNSFNYELGQLIKIKNQNLKNKWLNKYKDLVTLHKKENTEDCPEKNLAEETEFNGKWPTANDFIVSRKVNYTQECPEICSSLVLQKKFDKELTNKINKSILKEHIINNPSILEKLKICNEDYKNKKNLITSI